MMPEAATREFRMVGRTGGAKFGGDAGKLVDGLGVCGYKTSHHIIGDHAGAR
jgi:hypothetical protein